LRRRFGEAVAKYGIGARAAVTDKHRGLRDRSIMETARGMAGRITARRGLGDKLTARLDAAGVPMSPDEWLLVCVGVTVGTCMLVALLFRNPLVGVLVGIVAGLVGPRTFLSLKAGRRKNAFLTDLPEALQLMAGGMSSGYSLPQAVDSVVRLGNGVIAEEFGRALAQARLGTPVEDALDQVADRLGSKDLGWVVMAIRIQRRVGGNLSEVLLQVGETIRERAWLRRHVQGLSAEGRLSAYILGALPIVMGGYMFLVRRDYIRPLYTKPIGLVMLSGAATLLIIGALWMRKLVKVEL
jgi:tight adherence protein B